MEIFACLFDYAGLLSIFAVFSAIIVYVAYIGNSVK